MKYLRSLLLIFSIFLGSISYAKKNVDGCREWIKDPQAVLKPKYAQGFYLLVLKNKTRILVVGDSFYELLGNGFVKAQCPGLKALYLPLTKITSLSTTQLPALMILQKLDSLSGVLLKKYVYAAEIRERIKGKKIAEVGEPANLERVSSLRPDGVLAYKSPRDDFTVTKRMISLKLPVIYYNDFLETSPLARAEWLVFMGYLVNAEKKAKEVFNSIEKSYLNTEKEYSKIEEKPVVVIGEQRGGVWIAPGGGSDLAQMIKAAGGKYLWGDNDSRSPVRLSIEKAFLGLQKADVWLTHNSWQSLKDLLSADTRFKDVLPVKNARVYNNNKRLGPGGGNDYWEMGLSRPDLLLKDLVNIFHPCETKENKPSTYWYKKLE